MTTYRFEDRVQQDCWLHFDSMCDGEVSIKLEAGDRSVMIFADRELLGGIAKALITEMVME